MPNKKFKYSSSYRGSNHLESANTSGGIRLATVRGVDIWNNLYYVEWLTQPGYRDYVIAAHNQSSNSMFCGCFYPVGTLVICEYVFSHNRPYTASFKTLAVTGSISQSDREAWQSIYKQSPINPDVDKNLPMWKFAIPGTYLIRSEQLSTLRLDNSIRMTTPDLQQIVVDSQAHNMRFFSPLIVQSGSGVLTMHGSIFRPALKTNKSLANTSLDFVNQSSQPIDLEAGNPEDYMAVPEILELVYETSDVFPNLSTSLDNIDEYRPQTLTGSPLAIRFFRGF